MKQKSIMHTNNHMITNISEQLEKEFGKHETPERAKFDEEAYAFYTSQVLLVLQSYQRIGACG